MPGFFDDLKGWYNKLPVEGQYALTGSLIGGGTMGALGAFQAGRGKKLQGALSGLAAGGLGGAALGYGAGVVGGDNISKALSSTGQYLKDSWKWFSGGEKPPAPPPKPTPQQTNVGMGAGLISMLSPHKDLVPPTPPSRSDTEANADRDTKKIQDAGQKPPYSMTYPTPYYLGNTVGGGLAGLGGQAISRRMYDSGEFGNQNTLTRRLTDIGTESEQAEKQLKATRELGKSLAKLPARTPMALPVRSTAGIPHGGYPTAIPVVTAGSTATDEAALALRLRSLATEEETVRGRLAASQAITSAPSPWLSRLGWAGGGAGLGFLGAGSGDLLSRWFYPPKKNNQP